ncbi:hypothetical protein JTE90_001500 [Oedothorax gibbosus]|uniref:Uncharacterized protein n=1 Tax=Oedothorax gibbosus TaxID=931172 RepID=A0AAV6ULZ3_9ARAC|nr:hypothetical protein JTE90_001500 [Oedothorax gibbosus]
MALQPLLQKIILRKIFCKETKVEHAELNHINLDLIPDTSDQLGELVNNTRTMSSTSLDAAQESQTDLNGGSASHIATNQFDKPHRTLSRGKSIRETPKYHDVESYQNQRSHYIGTGVFNADNIDDLPPRYRTKVMNAFEWLAATFPQANMTAEDLIALEPSSSFRKPPQGYQNSRGNRRDNFIQQNPSNVPSDHVYLNHSSNTNREHLSRGQSFRGGQGSSSVHSRDSSTCSKDSRQARSESGFSHHVMSNQESQSLVRSPSAMSNNSQNSFPNKKQFQHDRKDSASVCSDVSLSTFPKKHEDFQSVQSSDRRAFDHNIPNQNYKPLPHRGGQSTKKNQPDSQGFVSRERQVHENYRTLHDNCSEVNITPNVEISSNSRNKRYKKKNDNSCESPNQTNLKTSPIESNKESCDSHSNKFSDITTQCSSSLSKGNPELYNTSSEQKNNSRHRNNNESCDIRTSEPNSSLQSSSNILKSSLSKRGRGRGSRRNNELDTNNLPVQNEPGAKPNETFSSDNHKDEHIERIMALLDQHNEHFLGHAASKSSLSESSRNENIRKESPNRGKSKSKSSVHSNQLNSFNQSHIDSQLEKPSFRKSKSNDTQNSVSPRNRVNRTFDDTSPNNLPLPNARSNRNHNRQNSNSSSDSFRKSDSKDASTSNHKNYEERRRTGGSISNRTPDNHNHINSSSSRDSFGRSNPRNTSLSNHKIFEEEPQFNESNCSKTYGDTSRTNDNHNRKNSNSLRGSFRRSNNNSKNFDDNRPTFESSSNRKNDDPTPISTSSSTPRSNANFNHKNSNSFKEPPSRSDSRVISSPKCNDSQNLDERRRSGKIDRLFEYEISARNTTVSSQPLISSAAVEKQKKHIEILKDTARSLNRTEEEGFFVTVSVSDSSDEMYWKKEFSSALKHNNFILNPCCKFNDSLILSFDQKCYAIEAIPTLKRLKNKNIVPGKPHLIQVGNVKYRRIRPCDCEEKMVYSCLVYFKDFSEKFIQEHQGKKVDIENEIRGLQRGKKKKFAVEQRKVLEESLRLLEDMERVFMRYINDLKLNLQNKPQDYFSICKLKTNFMRECQSFQRCLPIYSRKDDILELLLGHSVTVISAETGSGKSTQLAEYLLQSWVAKRGTIICTQPRKLAAISITNYVCGKIGSAVGKLVGYDVGTERKFEKDTKIIYMTDYALLRKLVRNTQLKGISCVIIDEAHERTLHTDLLLGMLKECINENKNTVDARRDLRVIITSATIDPSVFVRYFDFLKTAVIEVPGRAYPVDVVWLEEDVEVGWDYLKECVKTAIDIHTREPKGDILVFLTSPSEIDEAITQFRDKYSGPQMPMLMSLHGKSELQEQMRVFEATPPDTRKVIFATNAAETSLTIPGIKYVIDCGMAKEMTFFPAKNKNCLILTFINKSSAEQRKGRAGRTQPGICYRMYSQKNFQEMPDRSLPEILRTSLQGALLKIYELGFNPKKFDFVETPSKESIAKSLESLELLKLIKDDQLTDLGRKVVELPIEPRLGKLVLQGIAFSVGYEMIIIAAMVREAGRLFIRYDDIKVLADQKKIAFCQENGDLCTYLEVYKRWKELALDERYNWCVENFLSSKALSSAERTIKDILFSLHMDLSIRVLRRYNNAAFKSNFEKIVFNCFSENLCMYSGHPRVGYFSFILNDSLYIHPSSSLYYLGKDLPQFLVYSTLMQTSQNFLMDVTPINESVVNKSYHKGSFTMSTDVLKGLKILPKTMGPFGDIVLRNHIIGKGGSKIVNLEVMIEKLTNSRNFKIDIVRDKGTIIIYSESRFHERISQKLYETVKEAHTVLSKEEDIIKMAGFFYICVGSGGLLHDIVMPGEFREIIVENLNVNDMKYVENCLNELGDLKSIKTINPKKGKYKNFQIFATFTKVTKAVEAKNILINKNLTVKSTNFVKESIEKEAPIYRIQASWSRALSEGVGWVEFDSEADRIHASSCLTTLSFYIGHNYIRFAPSDSRPKQLDMRNLPLIIEESVIERKITELVQPLVPKTVFIKRKKLPAATSDESQQIQKKLASEFGRFTPPSKMIVDVNCPAYGDPMWKAVVYFENAADGENAFRALDGKLVIDSVVVKLNAVRKSHLFCNSRIVQAVKDDIEKLQKEFPTTVFTFNKIQNDAVIDIGFSCKTIEDLQAVQQKLSKLFQGDVVPCQGKPKFSHLFTLRGHRLIAEIQNSTKTLILLDNVRKFISIYGPKRNCSDAKVKICLLGEKEVSCKQKVFNLKNSHMPKGFLKTLYVKYGIDLQGLIYDFSLKAAVLNCVEGTLTIEGSSENVQKVEAHLESICTELYNKHHTVKVDDGREECDICLDPLSIDFYRLENCGHAFCKECLMLQVESKIVPLVCVKKDCKQELFMVDIKTLLSRADDDLRKNFYDAALQYHVGQNVGKLSYCPIPDCYLVYRVTDYENKLQCAGCQNTICTQCHTSFHYGMSCDMFKKCTENVDHSVKVWISENTQQRKQCGNCKSVIEKNEGCNHMECLNCHSHMCWLCLEIFPEDKDVYNHLPYCPQNQNRI